MRRVELADAVAVRRQYPAFASGERYMAFPVGAQRYAMAVLADKEEPDGETWQGECATARGNLHAVGDRPAGLAGCPPGYGYAVHAEGFWRANHRPANQKRVISGQIALSRGSAKFA